MDYALDVAKNLTETGIIARNALERYQIIKEIPENFIEKTEYVHLVEKKRYLAMKYNARIARQSIKQKENLCQKNKRKGIIKILENIRKACIKIENNKGFVRGAERERQCLGKQNAEYALIRTQKEKGENLLIDQTYERNE